jgi:hypothetical protein
MVCIGKSVGSLRMYGDGLGCYKDGEVGGKWCVFVVLRVCYGLLFYIIFSVCLVLCVLHMELYISCDMKIHIRVLWCDLMWFSLILWVCCSNV